MRPGRGGVGIRAKHTFSEFGGWLNVNKRITNINEEVYNCYSYFPPPLSWFTFVPQMKFIKCAQQKKNLLFWGNLVHFKSTGEKICILLTNWGINMHVNIPFIHPLSIIFSPNMLFGHIFAIRKIYTPAFTPWPVLTTSENNS